MVIDVVCTILTIYYFILLARVLLSWFPNLPDGVRPIARGIYAVTDPILRPLRGLIPPLRIGMMALDLSVVLVFFLLVLITEAICR